MIRCPICGCKTSVVETRAIRAGSRRRRRCASISGCPGKVTTVEIAVSAEQEASLFAEGNNILVPAKRIEQLRKAIAAIGGGDA